MDFHLIERYFSDHISPFPFLVNKSVNSKNSPFSLLTAPFFTTDASSVKQSDPNRIWRFLSLFTVWNYQLMIKVIGCFQSLLVKKIEQAKSITTPPKKSDSNTLFCQPIDYEKFRDQVLKRRKFNLHNLQSYTDLQSRHVGIFDKCENNLEKELVASIASYEAIVDLYVKRFLDKHPQLNDASFLPSLRMTALGIAIKAACDDEIYNSDFKDYLPPNISLSVHNAMELEFLKGLDWNLSTNELIDDRKKQPKPPMPI